MVVKRFGTNVTLSVVHRVHCRTITMRTMRVSGAPALGLLPNSANSPEMRHVAHRLAKTLSAL